MKNMNDANARTVANMQAFTMRLPTLFYKQLKGISIYSDTSVSVLIERAIREKYFKNGIDKIE